MILWALKSGKGLPTSIDLTGRTVKKEPPSKSYGHFREIRTMMGGSSYLYKHFIDSKIVDLQLEKTS